MKNKRLGPKLVIGAVFGFIFMALQVSAGENTLELNLRSRSAAARGSSVVESKARWDAKKTALIICDMWDDHWCKSAARRVREMAGPLNAVVRVARERGVFVIHSPSTCTAYY